MPSTHHGAVMSKSWKLAHPEQAKKHNRDYNLKLKERRKADPELDKRFREKRKAWEQAHPERSERGLRERILIKFGYKCSNPACQWLNADGSRGCTDKRCLQIDHVFGGGKQELKKISRDVYLRKVLADVDGLYQLLCANCNWIKRFTNEEIKFDRRPVGLLGKEI